MAICPKDPNVGELFCDSGCATSYHEDKFKDEDFEEAFPDPGDTCTYCDEVLEEEN